MLELQVTHEQELKPNAATVAYSKVRSLTFLQFVEEVSPSEFWLILTSRGLVSNGKDSLRLVTSQLKGEAIATLFVQLSNCPHHGFLHHCLLPHDSSQASTLTLRAPNNHL